MDSQVQKSPTLTEGTRLLEPCLQSAAVAPAGPCDMIIVCPFLFSNVSLSAARSVIGYGPAWHGSAGSPVSARRPGKEPGAGGAWVMCGCLAKPATSSSGTPRSTNPRMTSGTRRRDPRCPEFKHLTGLGSGTLRTIGVHRGPSGDTEDYQPNRRSVNEDKGRCRLRTGQAHRGRGA